ncbi:MAG: hypothetical protein ORN24_04090 [Burkholderiales bacterium]|nr:hypothetical protein [Burkholderiales bacterium]
MINSLDFFKSYYNSNTEVVRAIISVVTFLVAVYYARTQRKIFLRLVTNDTIKYYHDHYVGLSLLIKEFMILDYNKLLNDSDTFSPKSHYSQLSNNFLNLYYESNLFESNNIKSLIEDIRNLIVDINSIMQQLVKDKEASDFIFINEDDLLYKKTSELHQLHKRAKRVYSLEIKKLKLGIS